MEVIIPNLDSELPMFIAIHDRLAAAGICCVVPDRETLRMRGKDQLVDIATDIGVTTPTFEYYWQAISTAPGQRLDRVCGSRACSTVPTEQTPLLLRCVFIKSLLNGYPVGPKRQPLAKRLTSSASRMEMGSLSARSR